jgi:hypothetical protein
MADEFVEIFKDDNIKVFKSWRIRALSPLWWIVRVTQVCAGFVCFYAIYLGLWLIMG